MNEIKGVVIGLVTQVEDDLHQGRIKVSFRWLDANHETDWIRIATTMAGGTRGTFFMPEIDDEALLAFEHGDPRRPYAIGFLWNGVDLPPGQHYRDRKIVSKNGHQIRFLDASPEGGSLGALVIQDAHGNTITMSNGKITISSTAVLEMRAPTITINGRVVAPNANPI
jgi:uncharacterized protein involved in type VI secretion and phage assembly